jgi:formate hydrogenlyase transcriptional activator
LPVQDLIEALASSLDESSLLARAESPLSAVIPFDRCALLLYDELAGARKIVAVAGPLAPSHYEPGAEIPKRLRSHGWEAFEQRRCVCRPDLNLERPLPMDRLLYREGFRSLVAAPLIMNGTVIGTLNFGSKTAGAYTERTAPLTEKIAAQVANALAHLDTSRQRAALATEPQPDGAAVDEEFPQAQDTPEIVGRSALIKRLLERIHLIAHTPSTVLITGETGTGKELVAHAIHRLSSRRNKPFVRVNCAAIPAGLFESELLGHEKGAFTGAVQTRPGRFELADGGTIFLDEVGELPLDVQAKLLCILQDRVVERVGGTALRKVDVRVITATNRVLEDEVAAGRFRSDLYYRLKVIPVHVPPLRDRQEDIPLLAYYFLQKFGVVSRNAIQRIAPETLQKLGAYAWPGNVRELENVIERAVVLSGGPSLTLSDDLAPRKLIRGVYDTLENVECAYIREILEHTSWVVEGARGAAAILGLHPNTLRSRMNKLGIRRPGSGAR